MAAEPISVLFAENEASDWREAITLCGRMLTERGFAKPSFTQACIDRERRFPTGLPTAVGIAIPHAESAHVNRSCLCVLRLGRPVMFRRIDDPLQEIAVKVVVEIAIASDDDQTRTLSRLVRAFQDGDFLNRLSSLDEVEARAAMEDWLNQPGERAVGEEG